MYVRVIFRIPYMRSNLRTRTTERSLSEATVYINAIINAITRLTASASRGLSVKGQPLDAACTIPGLGQDVPRREVPSMSVKH